MGLDRRVIVALSVIALILAPAAVLRAVCAGHSCDEPGGGAANVPFCSLPEDQRRGIVAGFREGRSPDVLVVRGREQDDRVPLVMAGTGIAAGGSIEPGTTLDAVAPTLAEVMGLDRPHPEVRSGTAIPAIASGETPGVVVVIVVKGLGNSGLGGGAWKELRALGETGTMGVAHTGSQPADPAAVLTTVGTGGLPYQHGITGRLLRNDAGEMVTAWGPGSPVSVIATLADDLDELRDQKPKIALIAGDRADRGLIGGNWYVDTDRDVVKMERSPTRVAAAVVDLRTQGFGADSTPDLVAVTLSGGPAQVDKAIGSITDDAIGRGFAVVVTGTGTRPGDNGDVVTELERSIEGRTRLIEGAVPAGFFVDQKALAETGKTEDEVIDAVQETGAFTDAFAAITVTFARYC